MPLYWVSMIIQDTKNSEPWLCAMSEGCLSLDEAKHVIKKGRAIYRVLSAWIDTFPKNTKTIVFHECYINAVGDLKE